MSWINFENFRNSRPDLSRAWEQLAEWVNRHPDVKFFEVDRLADELYPISAHELVASLEALAEAGVVDAWLRVQDPTGVFLPGRYRRLEDIPSELPDRLNRYWFVVKPTNVVPVYYREAVGSNL